MKYSNLYSRNKYNAVQVELDGITFDSKAESVRYAELKLLEREKIIKNLQVHPKFELSKKGTNIYFQPYRAVTYSPDFTYYDNENKCLVAEDVKGYATDLYKLKRSLFMARYSEYKFIEIK